MASLADIMSEQLAETLTGVSKSPNNEHDAELEAVLLLSAQEAANNKLDAEVVDADADLALAMELQAQFDEENARIQQELSMQRIRGTSEHTSVSIDYGVSNAHSEAKYSDTDDEDEEEEEYWNNYNADYRDETMYGIGVKANVAACKPHGRVAGKELITKHNPKIASARNMSKMANNIDCAGDLRGAQNVQMSNKVFNQLQQHSRKAEGARNRRRGKREDRKVTENVMDDQTRLKLIGLVNSDVVSEVHGCVSQGKEASVYYATGFDADDESVELDIAIKIFKTVKNEFKTREKYMEGDWKFAKRAAQSNPMKFIRLWAEKEMRNLRRLQRHGIRCPRPLYLKDHLLVMEFVGVRGWPAPQLRVAELSNSKLRDAYLQCVVMMRDLHQKAELVHSDLSEYNMLFFNNELYFIDVSQAVETIHPNAIAFLRQDCHNVTQFFRRKGISNVLSTEQLFRFVTETNIDNVDEYLNNAQSQMNNAPLSNEQQVRAEVFRHAYVPQSLNDVVDPFAEVRELRELGMDQCDVFHTTLTGLTPDVLTAQ